MNIYIGNLSFDTTEEQLRQAFEAHGEVTSVNIITDKMTGNPRGFGFVEMADQASGQAAIAALSGTEMGGRQLNVNEAKPRTEGGNRGGGNRQRSSY